MRVLILLDNKTASRQADIDTALARIKTDYDKGAGGLTWQYEVRDFSNLTWVEYQPNALGVSWDTVRSDTQAIFLRDGEKWDNVIYVIDPSNWKAPNIGGWNLGSPIHGYCVELVIASFNPEWLYKIFAMEIAHSWNDVCIQEIGDNLLSTFGVPNDFDDRVIHGVDPRYGVNVPADAPLTGYYTNYDYTKEIAMAKDKLTLAYKTRLDRYTNGTYYFGRNLRLGMSGDDIIELQKRFAREGVAHYSPTGWFGPLTKASAIAYQQKHGVVPQSGFVGPITRGVLNTGSTAPSPVAATPAEADPLLLSDLEIIP